jgi:hypothetical protein
MIWLSRRVRLAAEGFGMCIPVVANFFATREYIRVNAPLSRALRLAFLAQAKPSVRIAR